MKKIITMLQPFALNQNIIVYENGNKIDMKESTIDNLVEEVSKLIEQYDIKQIDFIGAKQYAKGLGNKIKENELFQFNKDDLIINYL